MAKTPAQSPMENLGPRLKELRGRNGKSLREMARLLQVSPSFVSQIENGKSQPSVATLYEMAQLLGVQVDVLFEPLGSSKNSQITPVNSGDIKSRDQISTPSQAWDNTHAKISAINPSNRGVITMDSGVRWERLAATAETNVNFMEIIYQPGSESTPSGDLITHEGYEYGYALEGEIEVTIGDAVIALGKNHSIGFDSSIPHKLRNTGKSVFRGIWFVHGCGEKIEH